MKNRKYFIALLLVLALVVGLLTGCSNEKKEEPTAVPEATEAAKETTEATEAPAAEGGLTFTTGGTAGTYYAYGTVLATYVSNNSDLTVTAVAGTGSADNIDALDIGDAQLGFVQNDVANYAYNGIRFERYGGKPVKSFTAIAALYTETVQLVTCNPDIKSVADLKGKNVSIGSSGSGVYFQRYGLPGRL